MTSRTSSRLAARIPKRNNLPQVMNEWGYEVAENTGSVLALEHPCLDNPAHGRKMQLEVFGELVVAVRAGAIGGNDRIVAIAVFARKECSVLRPAKQAYACRTVSELCLFAYGDRRCRDTPQRLWLCPPRQ